MGESIMHSHWLSLYYYYSKCPPSFFFFNIYPSQSSYILASFFEIVFKVSSLLCFGKGDLLLLIYDIQITVIMNYQFSFSEYLTLDPCSICFLMLIYLLISIFIILRKIFPEVFWPFKPYPCWNFLCFKNKLHQLNW